MLLPTKKLSPAPFFHVSPPSPLWLKITYWKKVFLIAFRQILPKLLSVVHIFSFIITTYLEKFTGLNPSKQCPKELSPWIIPHVSPFYQKCITFHLACCPDNVWTTLPLPPNLPFGRNPVDGEESCPAAKKNAHLPHQKNPLHQIAIFM